MPSYNFKNTSATMPPQFWLIDDDPIANIINRKTISTLVSNVTPQIFDCPVDARDQLLDCKECNYPDFIFLDLNMPVMEGWEFLDVMNEEKIQIPVIILTSSFNKEDLSKARKYKQVKHFMTKPINVKELKKVLKRGR